MPDVSQSAAPAPAPVAAIAVGCTVRISGLKAKPELNQMVATVTAQKADRWVVQPNADGVAEVALKEDNLTLLVAEEVSAADVAPTPPAAAAAAGGGGGGGEEEGVLRVGCTVMINGLKSKPELNGKEGVVTAQKEARWESGEVG